MEIKVRAVGDAEEKAPQQVEQELLDKHEQKTEETKVETPTVVSDTEVKKEEVVPETVKQEIQEQDIVSYLKEKHNKEINSIDELFQKREQEDVPEDVSAYLKYRKETGRGFDDYVKLNRDIENYEPEELLREYLTETEEGLDKEDINDLLSEYHYDDEEDEESFIKKTKVAKKKKIAEAKKYFSKQKEYYKAPLESSGASISESELEKIKAYEQSVQESKKVESENVKKSDWFTKKTNEIFDGEFKGFEFAIDDRKIVYSTGDVAEVKKTHSTPLNFVRKFIDENGLLQNAAGYHKALAVAGDPDKFAKFFYEQGKSHATEDVMRKTKNINMSERKSPEVTSKGGIQIRSLSNNSEKGLKIKSLKRK